MLRLFLAALLVAACGRNPGPPRVVKLPKADNLPALRGGGAARSPRIASYKLDAKLEAARHLITATEVVTWTNTGGSAVASLPFHLYLNGFKNESSVFLRSALPERMSDGGWGWIQIESVQIAGMELANKLVYPGAPDETVVDLPVSPVQPGATIEIALKFTAQLPEAFARTGYKGDFTMVAQWFPKIGVRVGPPGAEHWECQPFHVNTEFFADFGTYDVTLTVPSTHVVAATGVLVSTSEAAGGMRTFKYHAEDVHDFAWMADPYMRVLSGPAKVEDGTVEVRVYARPEQAAFARRHLEAAIGAIERFSTYFGTYPWPIMSVIDPPVDAWTSLGGMEYPTLVTTGGDSVFLRAGMRIPEYITVHEVGHNWFQGMLASDEANEAWLDEGVNDWADAHVMTDLYGARTSGFDWGGWQAEVSRFMAVISSRESEEPSPIATAAYAFVDRSAYGEMTYEATREALTTLERTVGTQKFMAAMKAYAKAYAFKHPTGDDFYRTLEQELGQSLGWYFEPAFHEVGGTHLAVRGASCRPAHAPRGVFGDGTAKKTVADTEDADTGPYVCSVIVQNTGVVHVPVDVELRFADGSTERSVWDDRGGGHWQRFVVERSSPLVEVRLDPDDKISLDPRISHTFRLSGDGSASLRAAARIASWAQTLMQLVGP